METTDIQHFAKLIKEIKYAMLITVHADDGSLRSRPMTLQEADFDGSLWFFAGKSTQAVSDIQDQPKVNLAFSEPKNSSYISATGSAEVVFDKAKAKELWNPILKAWFPKGLEDPELCLIKVNVELADYWETPSSEIVQLVGFAKAILTGKSAANEIGERGHLNIT